MLAVGLNTPEQLAVLMRMQTRTAALWMALEQADISAHRAYILANHLGVRMAWLIGGEGDMAYSPASAEAVRIVNRMSAPDVAKWLAYGHRLLAKYPT